MQGHILPCTLSPDCLGNDSTTATSRANTGDTHSFILHHPGFHKNTAFQLFIVLICKH